MLRFKNKRAQSSAVEYVVTFFLVVAVITGMSRYVQRTLQAKARDALHYMADTVASDDPGKPFWFQYEPYYLQSRANVIRELGTNYYEFPSLPLGSGIAQRNVNALITSFSNQVTAPPAMAD